MKIDVPENWASAEDVDTEAAPTQDMPDFVKNVVMPMNAMPVSYTHLVKKRTNQTKIGYLRRILC